jgi:hypothetical protein
MNCGENTQPGQNTKKTNGMKNGAGTAQLWMEVGTEALAERDAIARRWRYASRSTISAFQLVTMISLVPGRGFIPTLEDAGRSTGHWQLLAKENDRRCSA